MEICGVKFTDKEQYEAVLDTVESLSIEGMDPSFERIKAIKDLLDGTLDINEINNES